MRSRARLRTATTRVAALVVALVAAAALAADIVTPAGGGGTLAQLLYGARTTWLVAVTGVTVALLVGGVLGALATRRGGGADRLLSRFAEMLGGYPTIVLVALVRALEPSGGLLLLAFALAMVRVPETARLVRMELLRLQASEFCLAARGLGATPTRLFLHHMLPHLAGALAQSAVFGVGLLALLEAAMTYVGLGVATQTPSWGAAIARAIALGEPARALPSIFALAATVIALYVLGDSLRDGLDPRSGERHSC
jgi:ABC-type dipeptide/oligopeptide/nickel transport system permease subunit